MNVSTYIRLNAMMLLQFFIWGSWFVTIGTFLDYNLRADGSQVGLAYSTQSWGALLALFIIGLVADRYLNAERILGVLHLLGAGSSALLRLFSFTLPKTPPLVSRKERVSCGHRIGLEAMKLLQDRKNAIFFICSFLICIPVAFYYSDANLFLVELNVENSAGKMTLVRLVRDMDGASWICLVSPLPVCHCI